MLVGVAGATIALVAAGGGAGAVRTVFAPCAPRSHVLCATVAVPLDPSAGATGRVALHVEELPARGRAPGGQSRVVFLVAGGPGQASAQAFDLRDDGTFWERMFPGYTLVAYDDRGTGGSGALRCPGLGAIVTASPAATARIVGACGR